MSSNKNRWFPSPYIKPVDLSGSKDVTVTIENIESFISDDGEKPKLSFAETDKTLILNLTNYNTIEALHGIETDDWIGQPIALFAVEVDYRGKSMLAVRVRPTVPDEITDADIPF